MRGRITQEIGSKEDWLSYCATPVDQFFNTWHVILEGGLKPCSCWELHAMYCKIPCRQSMQAGHADRQAGHVGRPCRQAGRPGHMQSGHAVRSLLALWKFQCDSCYASCVLEMLFRQGMLCRGMSVQTKTHTHTHMKSATQPHFCPIFGHSG